jgi:CBS domain containing-hemolysin-like protein
LDSSLVIVVATLFATTILLVLIAAAEAGVMALSRGRIRAEHPNGLGGLLLSYIRQRQRILRTLSVATTAVIVICTGTLMFALLRGSEVTIQATAAAAAASFLFVAFVRQTTRSIVLLNPERWGLRLSLPIRVLQIVFTPLAWLTNAPINLLLRLVGRSDALIEPDPTEELVGLLEVTEAGEEPAMIEQRRMMRGVIDMTQQTVRELMTPRTDLVGVTIDASMGDVMKVISESGYSRIPLYDDSLDTIVGVVYAKDLLAYLRTGDITPKLQDICRPAYFVPETKRADELLADLRRDQVHLAIAVDEYGGTAGVVTVEDLLEEIVGEISDEYDVDEVEVERLANDEAIVDARMTIDELNELFGTSIESDDFDTVGGLIFTLLGRLASPGDEVSTLTDDSSEGEQGLQIRVLSVLGRRIKKVRVKLHSRTAEPATAGAA